MSIRRRIYRSYVIQIVIVLLYLFFSFFLNSFILRVERENNRILEVKTLWGDMLVHMNETVSNWNDGKTYKSFIDDSTVFEEKIADLATGKGLVIRYRGDANRYIDDLYRVWKLAKIHIERIKETRMKQDFLIAVGLLTREPGLQRLHRPYHDINDINDSTLSDRTQALRDYIDAVEFFPIYSGTANYLFRSIQDNMDAAYKRLRVVKNVLNIMFFTLFITAYILISGHFTNTLSRPLIRLSDRLNDFIGKAIPSKPGSQGDELNDLERSVEDLIAHLTHLSRLALRLSRGHIETSLLSLPHQGVVGNALKEVAAYLKNLTNFATGIHEGLYGSVVDEKSEQDVLARSFNIMSRTIAEKINTLTSMFETIDEGILLVDSGGKILEANHRFLGLIGARELEELEYDDLIGRFISGDERVLDDINTNHLIIDLYCDLRSRSGEIIPIKLNTRLLEYPGENRTEVMIIVSNESVRVRMRREQKQLESQAMEAELKALRAQINPHFLFNTLNTIAHLIETDEPRAVDTVEKLAEIFRYTLLSTKRQKVPLAEELLHIRELLDIERIRHGARLDVQLEIDKSVEDWEIPPMLIQPIVENCIKYGADADGTIHIMIKAYRENDVLVVNIADRGVKNVDIEQLLNNGRTGLTNINQRLLTIYQSGLEFEQQEKGGLVVSMKIPYSEDVA